MLSEHPRIKLLSLLDAQLLPNIDVWHLDLDHITLQDHADARTYLAPQELERADRYRHIQDQQHFSLRRMLLKQLLSVYTKVHPRDVQLEEDEHKKPRIMNDSNLHFNASHTPLHGIVAVHPSHSVGVDIEPISAIEDRGCLLDQFASLDEKRWVHTSTHRFFMVWTIKEALLKCQGTGFLVDTVPTLEALPVQISEYTYVARSQGYIIYSTFWEKHWISICRPDG
jgi:4'-phosphopantetheinyl transferase